ncbi:MAG: family 1 glycosylhydrolase [Bryobacteraceae bacterium]
MTTPPQRTDRDGAPLNGHTGRPGLPPIYAHLGGFESTLIFGTGQDILETTRHIEQWREDLMMLLQSGIRKLRYSIPWHRIEKSPGRFNWGWMDGPMQFMRDSGLEPILDPLHHTSFPEWLEDGFLHPDFVRLYSRFIDEISNRYEWVHRYTVFNEPLATTIFCSSTGMWYPHRASDHDYVAMTLQVARCISHCIALLRRKNKRIQIVHVDTAEHHRATDKKSEDWAEFANQRRFVIVDLVLGRINADHPLYPYLKSNGATEDALHWFEDHPESIDLLGLDYYLHSEMEWFWSNDKGRADIRPYNDDPRGFAAVAEDYVEKYRKPILLSETNIRGTVEERLTWLKFMEEQCEELVRQGIDFREFCWYPSIDSTDWANACTRCTKITDPQGIWWLDSTRVVRHESELSHVYGALARGLITSKDIPAYGFSGDLDRRMRGYKPLMSWTSSGEQNSDRSQSVSEILR